jgi:hypothetical protein
MDYRLGVDVEAEDQWQEVNDHCAEVHLHDAEPLFRLFEERSWTAGYRGLTTLAEKVWKNVSATARGAFITGLSRQLLDSAVADWITGSLDDAFFDAQRVVEICCNAIRYGRTEILKALLNRPDLPTEPVERFSETEYQRDWRSDLAPHSQRFFDVLLECAVRSQNAIAAGLALERGANPNIPCFRLERNFKERFSVLSFAINDCSLDVVALLLDHRAHAQGLDYEEFNKPLFVALRKGIWTLVDKLLSLGASFEGRGLSPSAQGDTAPKVPTARIVGSFKKEAEWAEASLGKVISLAPVHSVPWFYTGHGQGGEYRSFLVCLLTRNDLVHIKMYEPLGLSLRLTALDVAKAIKADAYDSLWYVLGRLKAPPQAYIRILRHNPGFGTRHVKPLDHKSDARGFNVVANFNPHGQLPLELPDGSRLYAHLDSIAQPGHSHGAADSESYWFEEVICQYRRRGDQIVVRKPRRRWIEMPFNESNVSYCHEFLPMVREVNGKFIWAGINMLGLSRLGPEAWQPVFEEWWKSACGALRTMIVERAKAQMSANALATLDA